MSRKLLLTSLFIVLCLSIANAQNEKTVLSAPRSWEAEMIPFPLPFAPELDFSGVEDIRFAPGWSDSTSLDFWTYTFVWNVEMIGMMSTEKLDEIFSAYYNGLIPAVLQENEETEYLEEVGEAVVEFEETEDGYQGAIEVFDSFFTKKRITLYIKVSEFFCIETERQLIRSDISLFFFAAPQWDEFEKVKITANCEK